MGYYSEVGLKIAFRDSAGRDKIIAALGDDWNRIAEIVVVGDTTIEFYAPWAKWYDEFKDVQAVKALLGFAESLNSLDDEDRVPSSGFFARVGEEQSDIETMTWDSRVNEIPSGWELGEVIISIELKEV